MSLSFTSIQCGRTNSPFTGAENHTHLLIAVDKAIWRQWLQPFQICDIFSDVPGSVIIIASVQKGNIHIHDIDQLLTRHKSIVIGPQCGWQKNSFESILGSTCLMCPLKASICPRQRCRLKTLIRDVIWELQGRTVFPARLPLLTQWDQHRPTTATVLSNMPSALQQRLHSHRSDALRWLRNSKYMGVSPVSLPILFIVVITHW